MKKFIEDILNIIGGIIQAILFFAALAWFLSIFGLLLIIHWFQQGNPTLAWIVIILNIIILIYIIFERYFHN